MNSKEYLNKMTNIQQNFLNYIDDEGEKNQDEKYIIDFTLKEVFFFLEYMHY